MMKNFALKSFVVTCVTGIAILLTPKTSVAQVNMSLLTEVAQSCQKDLLSPQYFQQMGFDLQDSLQFSKNGNFSDRCLI
jgi:hypothetical protein